MRMFTSDSGLSGMLLEEAVLSLISTCGYRAVDRAGSDPLLRDGRSGLEVRGRGEFHQIDAVADYLIPQPFTHPFRLLIEAKYYPRRPVEIETVRNSVGVEKDLREYSGPHPDLRPRCHYRSAIVSATNFTGPAQRYAYAHDVYLLPMGRSMFFRPVLDKIEACRLIQRDAWIDGPISTRSAYRPRGRLRALRMAIRHALRERDSNLLISHDSAWWHSYQIRDFVEETCRLNYSLIATIGPNIPIFLTPGPGIVIDDLRERQDVRIFWDDIGWILRDLRGRKLFSFDLPSDVFNLYAEGGILQPNRALDLKMDLMSSIRALVSSQGQVRLIQFLLDQDWIHDLFTHNRV